jgi:hypothetical protein
MELTIDDLSTLISCMTSRQAQLIKSGDYPEILSDSMLLTKLLQLKHELKTTGGMLIVISD